MLKGSLIWTLTVGILSGALGAGVYRFYQDSLKDIENNTRKYIDEVNLCYLRNRSTSPRYLEMLKEMDLEYDYAYFGAIDRSGNLTDIYETSYDDQDIWLSTNENVIDFKYEKIFDDDYSSESSAIKEYSSIGAEDSGSKYTRYRITHDASKAGKIETDKYYDNPYIGPTDYIIETRYLLCSDPVYDLIRSSGQKAGKKNVRTMLYNNMSDNYTISKKINYDSFLRDDQNSDPISASKKIVSAISPYLFDFRSGSDEDPVNREGITLNCTVDEKNGRIGVGTVKCGDKVTSVNDSGFGAFNDSAVLDKVSIDRPDSILAKYGSVFKPSKIGKDVVGDLEEYINRSVNDRILEHVESYDGKDRRVFFDVRADNQYEGGEQIATKTTMRKYEDGHVILCGVMLYDLRLYRFAYTIPFAGFGESAGNDILGAALKIWLPGLVIILLAVFVSHQRYMVRYRQSRFKEGLIDALAHNMKTPMQIISVSAENLYDPVSEKARKNNIDSILSETRGADEIIGKILKAAEKEPVKTLFPVREAVEATASELGLKLNINGDMKIRADRELFAQALYNLLDNADKYRLEKSEISVRIDRRKLLIENSIKEDKFTPGAGIAIADRYLTQTGMQLRQKIKDGRFISEIKFI